MQSAFMLYRRSSLQHSTPCVIFPICNLQLSDACNLATKGKKVVSRIQGCLLHSKQIKAGYSNQGRMSNQNEGEVNNEATPVEADSNEDRSVNGVGLLEGTMKNLDLQLNLDEDEEKEKESPQDIFQTDSGEEGGGELGFGEMGISGTEEELFSVESEGSSVPVNWGEDSGVDTAGWANPNGQSMQTLHGPTDVNSLDALYGDRSFSDSPQKFSPDERRLNAVKHMIYARDGEEGGKECRFFTFVNELQAQKFSVTHSIRSDL